MTHPDSPHPNGKEPADPRRGRELALRLAEHIHDTEQSYIVYELTIHEEAWAVEVRRL